MDVARQDDDRRRRRAALARAHGAQLIDQEIKRRAERRPVLEVEPLADLLAQPRGQAAPGAGADRLVPALQLVQPVRQQQRQRGGDQQVVDVAGQLLAGPRPLLVGEHLALGVVADDPAGARVEDDQARGAEVARVAPARAGDLVARLPRPVAQHRRHVLRAAADLLEEVVRAQLARARGSRCAGRSSRRRRRRGSAPPTSPSRASRAPTCPTCSSRRARRGRRRSSPSAGRPAAGAAPGRPRPRGRARCTPRSRRPRCRRRSRGRAAGRCARRSRGRPRRRRPGRRPAAARRASARVAGPPSDGRAPRARRPRGRPSHRPCVSV